MQTPVRRGKPAVRSGLAHDELRVGLFSQWYDPEPTIIPAVLARELTRRHHSVKVLTGFPNYPEGRIYAGYRQATRTDNDLSWETIPPGGLFPSPGPSMVRSLPKHTTLTL